jgi:hypothetical protein
LRLRAAFGRRVRRFNALVGRASKRRMLMTSWIFKPIMLVCALGQSPWECTPETARLVVRGEPAKNETMCAMYGQFQLSGTSIGRELTRDEWVKVTCEREKAE